MVKDWLGQPADFPGKDKPAIYSAAQEAVNESNQVLSRLNRPDMEQIRLGNTILLHNRCPLTGIQYGLEVWIYSWKDHLHLVRGDLVKAHKIILSRTGVGDYLSGAPGIMPGTPAKVGSLLACMGVREVKKTQIMDSGYTGPTVRERNDMSRGEEYIRWISMKLGSEP
jgi:hypothetical protein